MTLLQPHCHDRARPDASLAADMQAAPRGGLRVVLPAADVLIGLFFTVCAHGLQYEAGLMAALYLLGFRWAGLHRARLNPSALEELPRALLVMAAAIGVVLSLRSMLGHPTVPPGFVHVVIFESIVVILARAAIYSLVRQARRSGLVSYRTLLIGADPVARELAEVLQRFPEYGLHPIGFVDDFPAGATATADVPVLGDLDDLRTILADHRVEAAVVAFPSAGTAELRTAMRRIGRAPAQLFVVPPLFEVHTDHYLGDSVRGIPLIRLHRPPLSGAAWQVKRALDITFSALALACVAPVLVVCALAVRLEGGPGVLFRQERVGRDGRTFQLLKFRSLRPVSVDESATRWTVAHDDRLGPVGRLLRKTSLDELPQLVNVLRGEMSLVGPRPERPYFVSKFSEEHPDYVHRHRMPAGLTGWAAINGLRGDTSIAERARYDNYYIENWSLWLDISILLRTVGHVLRGSGA